MHAFVAAILLRPTWFDPLDLDSESEPPDGELAQVEESVGGGKGHTVVGADGDWQAAFLKEVFEGRESKLFPRRRQRLAEQNEARGMIGDGERIAVDLVAELELAFVIGTPQIVGARTL